MTISTSQRGEQAWKTYQDIESVVIKKYKLTDSLNTLKHTRVSEALQRLGEAVLLRHNLMDKQPSIRKWIIKLDKANVRMLPLSTTKEMISAQIPIWEDELPGIPDMMVAHDSWVNGYDGRAAAFRKQPSLKEILKCDYSELKASVDTTSKQALKIFEHIQKVVQLEISRIASISTIQGVSRDKATEISNAMKRLHQAIQYKYNLPSNSEISPTIKKEHVDAIDLYTFDTMLDAEFREWESYMQPFKEPGLWMGRNEGYKSRRSVRQALNLARGNIFSIFSLQKPLWGKSTSLQNVERELLSISHPRTG